MTIEGNIDFRELTVVVPTFNEAGNIGTLIERLNQFLPGVSVIVVDDGSKDGTPDVVRVQSTRFERVQLIERTGKPCLTLSIEEGVQAAQTEFVGWLDADLSHPPELFRQLHAFAQGSGCCIATRFSRNRARDKITEYNDNIFSSMLSYILNVIVFNVLRLSITDYTSGFIVLKKSLVRNYRFDGDYGEYFIHLCFYLSHVQKVRIEEVPYESPPRQWGESKTGTTLLKLFRRGIKYLWMVLKLASHKFGISKIS